MNKHFIALAMLTMSAIPAIAEPHQGVVSPIKQVSVNSPVSQDIITKMHVREGDTVKEGDVLVELRKDREEIKVRVGEKQVELRKFIARGQEKLFKEQMGSEEKALEARTDLELYQNMLEADRLTLKEKTILSPLSGRVVKKYKESGESVTWQDKLVDIINIEQVNVRFYLPPNLRRNVKENDAVQVKIADLDGAVFTGKITFVDPRNDAASGLVQVWVEIENRDFKIAPGMKGQADFGK